MNDSQQAPQPVTGPSPDALSRHEYSEGIDDEDVGLLAAFAKRVGNELYTVDHQNVGSNSNIKALRLDNEKIFAGKKTGPATPQRPAPPSPSTTDTKRPLEASTPPPPPQEPVSSPQPLPAPPAPLNKDIDKRLSKLERATKAFRNAKRIKRGVSYTVSSNSFKGVIKDAELLAEYIISEVAKGVKSITIKRNDSKNTE